jgi:hypothetical protein
MRRFGVWFVKEAASGLIALGVFEAAQLIAAGWPPLYTALAAPYAPFWFIGFGVIAGLIWVAWPQTPRPFARKQPTVQGSAGRVEVEPSRAASLEVAAANQREQAAYQQRDAAQQQLRAVQRDAQREQDALQSRLDGRARRHARSPRR